MTLQKTFDNPSAVPAPAGHFSHVVRLGLGGDSALLFVSGQVALDADGRVVGPGDSRLAEYAEVRRGYFFRPAAVQYHRRGLEVVAAVTGAPGA